MQLELRDPEAESSLLKAREIQRDETTTWVLLARVFLELENLRDYKKAEDFARGAVSLSPDDPKALRILATALLRQGKYADAIEIAETALAASGNRTSIHLLLSIANAHLGSIDDAKSHFETAIAAWPHDLRAQGVRITAAKGVLWYEHHDELEKLRSEAAQLIPD